MLHMPTWFDCCDTSEKGYPVPTKLHPALQLRMGPRVPQKAWAQRHRGSRVLNHRGCSGLWFQVLPLGAASYLSLLVACPASFLKCTPNARREGRVLRIWGLRGRRGSRRLHLPSPSSPRSSCVPLSLDSIIQRDDSAQAPSLAEVTLPTIRLSVWRQHSQEIALFPENNACQQEAGLGQKARTFQWLEALNVWCFLSPYTKRRKSRKIARLPGSVCSFTSQPSSLRSGDFLFS